MGSDRNLALARTEPDIERVSARFHRPAEEPLRDSQITIRATNHPISDALDRLADSAAQHGHDVLDALSARDVEAIKRLPVQQRMLAARLRVLAAEARAVEELVLNLQGDR